jgi:predicted N-acetyltransferase YhbS
MTDYRLLTAEEYPAAVELWTSVFGVEREFFTSLLEGGRPEDNVSVAALEDGQIVSSVHVFMRQIRDRSGTPLKVGGIGSVSTHSDHRKKGHSGRLLEMAIEEMEKAGCVWSYLGTGVNDHYARYGWKTVSTASRSGTLRSDLAGEAIELTGEDDRQMAELYEAFTATRPMATVRTEQAWKTAVRYRIDPARATTLGIREDGRLVAYVVVRNLWGAWNIADAAYATGFESCMANLFATAGARAKAQGATENSDRLTGNHGSRRRLRRNR